LVIFIPFDTPVDAALESEPLVVPSPSDLIANANANANATSQQPAAPSRAVATR